jgi:hypothetical protein
MKWIEALKKSSAFAGSKKEPVIFYRQKSSSHTSELRTTPERAGFQNARRLKSATLSVKTFLRLE